MAFGAYEYEFVRVLRVLMEDKRLNLQELFYGNVVFKEYEKCFSTMIFTIYKHVFISKFS